MLFQYDPDLSVHVLLVHVLGRARQPAMVVVRQQGPCSSKRARDARMFRVGSRFPRSALAPSVLSNMHQM